MVQIRINCHVRRKPTGSIPVQFYFFATASERLSKGVPVVHIPKRQHVLIDYTTTNQTYGANYRATSERYM
jgi:hypothetical protein